MNPSSAEKLFLFVQVFENHCASVRKKSKAYNDRLSLLGIFFQKHPAAPRLLTSSLQAAYVTQAAYLLIALYICHYS